MVDDEIFELDFEPDESEEGERVDVVVARRSGIPRAAVQQALAAGAVTVGGRTVKASRRVEASERIHALVPRPGPHLPLAEDIPLEIRYDDERVLVVSKPPGLVTHPAGGHEGGTLVNALLGLGVPLAGAGSPRPGIVHRLDKDTSGLVLVAKDDAALAHLQRELKARRVERTYVALVGGRLGAASGTIDAPIARHSRKRTVMAVVAGGRPAVTHYRVIEAAADVSLLEVTLESGRTHQIRVHLAYIGHPVAGDRVYGGARAGSAAQLGRPFLHARRLAFPHPDDGRRVEVEDPLPADLTQALRRLDLAAPPGFHS